MRRDFARPAPVGLRWVARPFAGPHFALALFAVAVPLFAACGLVRVGLHQVDGYDLGLFTQVVQRYAHFQAPLATLKGDGFNILGDHFHPIIAAWVPLYWLWSGPGSLVIGQALVVAATVFPLWRFVRRHWRGSLSPRILTATALAGWPILTLVCYDVHEIAFAIPLLAWAIDALDRRAVPALLVSCGLLLLVREDMGTAIAMIGAVWLAWPRPRHRTRGDWAIGVGLVLGGALAVALITRIVIPHFDPRGYQYWAFSDFGDTLASALTSAVRRPWRVIWLLFWPPLKTATWLVLLVPLGFWPLRSPYALIALPLMVERMLGMRQNMWVPGAHYDAPIWIVLVFAAVAAWGRLPDDRLTRVRIRVLVTISLVMSLVTALIEGVYVAITTTASADRAAAVAFVPADTCVVASNRLAGDFVATNRVTVPAVSQQRQDFYVVDLRGQSFGRAGQPFFRIGESVHGTTGTDAALAWTGQQVYDYAADKGFRPVYQSGDVVVLQAPDYAGPDPATCGPDAP